VINRKKEEIQRACNASECNELGEKGKKIWKRFEESNRIADENLDQYPRLLEVYIFEHNVIKLRNYNIF
jgi:hypothetical protein